MAVPYIEDMAERMDAVEAGLRSALPNRVVKRSLLKHFDDHEKGEIELGVVMLISAGEGRYNTALRAREGWHRMMLVGHLKVDEAGQQGEVEKAELALIKEIKSFVQTGIAGTDIELERVEQSRQLEYPYGWVVAWLNVGRPYSNVR